VSGGEGHGGERQLSVKKGSSASKEKAVELHRLGRPGIQGGEICFTFEIEGTMGETWADRLQNEINPSEDSKARGLRLEWGVVEGGKGKSAS